MRVRVVGSVAMVEGWLVVWMGNNGSQDANKGKSTRANETRDAYNAFRWRMTMTRRRGG